MKPHMRYIGNSIRRYWLCYDGSTIGADYTMHGAWKRYRMKAKSIH